MCNHVRCEDCKWIVITEDGDGWNEPRETYIECNCKIAVTDDDISYIEVKSDEGYNGDPIDCKFFDAGICEECGKSIKSENLLYACCAYANHKVCGEECGKVLQAKLDKTIKDMMA